MNRFFLARQPIFDCRLKLFAYELLFRSSLENVHGGVVDDDASTAQVIANAAELGLQKLTRGRQAFINLPQRFLEDPELVPLDPTWMVLEILETVTLNDACMRGIRILHERGFRLALDDFVDTMAFDAILPLVDIVKIDVLSLSQPKWAEQIARLREHDCRILAEKVETREAFEALSALDVDYFQGYFFARPRIVEGRQIPAAKMDLLRTLARLNDPQSSVDDIQDLLSRDPVLSTKVLNYVNSAANGPARPIESIREAIVHLGCDKIRRWTSLYVLAGSDSDPGEGLTLALQRARVCEVIAAWGKRGHADACFTAGLFSMLDALMDTPLPHLLRQMSLTEDMREALLSHAGDTGTILACAKSMESGDIPWVSGLNLTVAQLGTLQAEAFRWTDNTLRDMGLE